jgi:LmbE family N-acetylglucosaminyl deacetylase
MSARADSSGPPPPTPLRVLLLAAHPHDEFGIAATLHAHTTAGDEVFASWYAPDDRPEIRERRQAETRRAMGLVGVPEENLEFADLEPAALTEQLPELVQAVRDTIERVDPDLVYVPAFEGGHPDHDAVDFAAWEAATSVGIETLEFPLYRASERRRFFARVPMFARLSGAPDPQRRTRRLQLREVDFKRKLWSVYRSQRPLFDVLLRVSGDEERYFSTEPTRPLPLRDYTKPPHERPLLYERDPEIPFSFDEFADRVRRYHWSGGVPENKGL